MINENQKQTIKDALYRIRDWDTKTAYERTKLCCAEIVRLGIQPPNWMVIRELVGKGSAGDIQRAITDSRKELADTLKKLESAPAGVPQELAPLVNDLWVSAVSLATANFEAQVSEWKTEVELASITSARAHDDRDQANILVDNLKIEISGLNELVKTLRNQILSETAARQQAEKMAEHSRQELAEQRGRLEEELKRSQQELNAALDRLDGVEAHSLRELDRIKTELGAQINTLNEKIKRDAADAKMLNARQDNIARELRGDLAEVRQELALSQQQNSNLEKQISQKDAELARTISQLNRAATENEKLLSSLAFSNEKQKELSNLVDQLKTEGNKKQ